MAIGDKADRQMSQRQRGRVRQAGRQTGRTVGWCLTRSDLETSQLGGNCQTLAGSCWLIWAVMEKNPQRELRGSERGRMKDRRGREESSKTWRGVKKENDRGQTIHCYVLDIFLMIFIELIQWCRSSNTPANTVDWIEIELSRMTEERIESGILKDKADGIERQWWKEDGCKKMERCETKKGQSIWRKFDVENVRMSWKVWDMTGRKEVWCSLKQVCASLWHIVNHQATLILTKQQFKKEDKKRKKMICTPRSCHPHWIWVENWMCDR